MGFFANVCKPAQDARQWRVRFLTSKTNLAYQNRKKNNIKTPTPLPDKIKRVMKMFWRRDKAVPHKKLEVVELMVL